MTLKAGDTVYTANVTAHTDTGEVLFYWIELPCHPYKMRPAKKRKLLRKLYATPTAERHGPFATKTECDRNMRLVLCGDCPVEEGEGFPSPGTETIN